MPHPADEHGYSPRPAPSPATVTGLPGDSLAEAGAAARLSGGAFSTAPLPVDFGLAAGLFPWFEESSGFVAGDGIDRGLRSTTSVATAMGTCVAGLNRMLDARRRGAYRASGLDPLSRGKTEARDRL